MRESLLQQVREKVKRVSRVTEDAPNEDRYNESFIIRDDTITERREQHGTGKATRECLSGTTTNENTDLSHSALCLSSSPTRHRLALPPLLLWWVSEPAHQPCTG